MEKGRRSTRPTPRTRPRWRSTRPGISWSAPGHPAKCCGSILTARRSSSSIRRSRKSTRCASTTRHALRAAISAGPVRVAPWSAPKRSIGRARTPHAHPWLRSRRDHLDVDRGRWGSDRPDRRERIDDRPKARSTASRPMACGTSCGSRARIRLTISPSIRTARSSSGPATRASSIASTASRRARR